MSQASPKADLPVGWSIAWVLILVLASALPYLHWRDEVAQIIEPLRYPWGLLPAHWLAFRWSGEVATYALVLVVLSGAWAWFHPKYIRSIVLLSALVTLVATLASAMLNAGLMVAFIHEEGLRRSNESDHCRSGSPEDLDQMVFSQGNSTDIVVTLTILPTGRLMTDSGETDDADLLAKVRAIAKVGGASELVVRLLPSDGVTFQQLVYLSRKLNDAGVRKISVNHTFSTKENEPKSLR